MRSKSDKIRFQGRELSLSRKIETITKNELLKRLELYLSTEDCFRGEISKLKLNKRFYMKEKLEGKGKKVYLLEINKSTGKTEGIGFIERYAHKEDNHPSSVSFGHFSNGIAVENKSFKKTRKEIKTSLENNKPKRQIEDKVISEINPQSQRGKLIIEEQSPKALDQAEPQIEIVKEREEKSENTLKPLNSFLNKTFSGMQIPSGYNQLFKMKAFKNTCQKRFMKFEASISKRDLYEWYENIVEALETIEDYSEALRKNYPESGLKLSSREISESDSMSILEFTDTLQEDLDEGLKAFDEIYENASDEEYEKHLRNIEIAEYNLSIRKQAIYQELIRREEKTKGLFKAHNPV